jgi:serine protease Do
VDQQSDLAVIKIEADSLPVAAMADSTKVRVGEFAIAIGAPLSLDYSVTFGHVSAKGRSNVIPSYEGGASMDQDFIQTDANINPGNSGGPLVNIDGEVIGINTLISGLRTGIGFAIPSNLAREVADQIIVNGKFTRAWLGVEIRALREDPELREQLKTVKDGVIVSRVLPGSPAAKSGMKQNDIILSVDGDSVGTPQELRSKIRGRKVGTAVALNVYREGKQVTLKPKPTEWVQQEVARAPARNMFEMDPAGLGLSVHSMGEELAKRLGMETSKGVLIVAVEKGKPAALQGIKPGEIITDVDEKPVTSTKDFKELLAKADLKKGVSIKLLNGTKSRVETIKQTSTKDEAPK